MKQGLINLGRAMQKLPVAGQVFTGVAHLSNAAITGAEKGANAVKNVIAKGKLIDAQAALNKGEQYIGHGTDAAKYLEEGIQDIADRAKNVSAKATARAEAISSVPKAKREVNRQIKEARRAGRPIKTKSNNPTMEIPKTEERMIQKKVLGESYRDGGANVDKMQFDAEGKKYQLKYETGKNGKGRYYAASLDGGKDFDLSEKTWMSQAKKNFGEDFSADDIFETAMGVSEFEVGQGAGVNLGEFIKNHPVISTGVAVGSGFVISRLLDDD